MKKIIAAPQAPAAVGPYSQAVAAGNTLYLSGQLPIDAANGRMPEGIEAQTAAMNAVYAEFFTRDMPARVCYEVARLPMGALVEIDAVAVK